MLLDDELEDEEEVSTKRSTEEDDEDDEEYFKKHASSSKKKGGKKAYEEEDDIVEDFIYDSKPSGRKIEKAERELREILKEEVLGLTEEFSLREIFEGIRSINLIPNELDECLEKGCDNPATTSGYCRYHYIKSWKDIKKKQTLISEGKLQAFIEDLVKKYPSKVIENILSDLADEKSFYSVLKEMDIEATEDSFEDADEDLVDDDADISVENFKGKSLYED
ncbi:MAG: hypothetical protein COW00_09030 [Bdellovibrio sp. CG12_big_fil_rev_8_21_14_0_65_39_13]|nr:MAG: hypothetical protein COW78_09100 [Bdellovibrio sp. CG22_combo_CG10-13_8_21_14_all_39_27]PIQ59768.1 MAG: hypothetical protein COW00_09030 [Bdellovibrio sp. CG12_big_fil_rev_8_21_14_0_65_39_13]